MNSQHHRGDPLDIPLIDHHLLTQLLLPRLISAIRVAFPQRQKDWTTDSRKRILEGVFRTCLMLGSSRHIISYVARQRRRRHDVNSDIDSSGNINYGKVGQTPRVVNHDVYVTTPAMQSLGISIRPASSSDGAGGSIIQQYGKVIALIIATVILPICYEELKHRREKHLDERDQHFRLEEIRREFRSSMMQGVNNTSTSAHNNTAQETASDDNDIREIEQQPHHYQQQHLLNKHAMKRKSFVSALFTDSILGMGEVIYPPLKLASYLMYLWGMCSTPDLGMRMAGWDYCRIDPSSSALELGEPPSHDGESSHHYQRHANFQYGHRRLMVEEALRAATMILPPRTYNAGFGGAAAAATGNAVVETPLSTNGRSNDLVVAPQNSRMARFGTLRKRLLSFLGIVDESNNDFAEVTNSFDTLCSLCNTIPAVPYTASCGHYYCYICLRMAVTDDLNFRCKCCGQQISSACRSHSKLKA
jgi:hypothetical protein